MNDKIKPIASSELLPPESSPAPDAPPIDQKQVNSLLAHVMAGDLGESEKMIKDNPQLLNHKGAGKEFHCDRAFKSITPFQYALWARDWHMWDMMMQHMDHAHARDQLEELDSHGTEHGMQFDGLKELENMCRLTIQNSFSDQYKFKEKKLRKDLPVNVQLEYWRKDWSNNPVPNFRTRLGQERDQLLKSFRSYVWYRNTYIVRLMALGNEYEEIRSAPVTVAALILSAFPGAMISMSGPSLFLARSAWMLSSYRKKLEIALPCIIALNATRISQYEELKETLRKAPDLCR